MASLDPVVRTDAAQRRGIGVGAFVLALATAGAMAHVGVRMKGIEVAYELGREKRVNTQLEEERRRLNIEIGMLKDPGRVVAIARDRLKMGPPAPTDIVRIEPGQILAPAPPVVEAPKRAEHAATARPRVAHAPSASTPTPSPEAAPTADDAAPEGMTTKGVTTKDPPAQDTSTRGAPAPAAEGDE